MDFKFGVQRCQYSGSNPSFVRKPGLSVHGTRLFLACLSPDLDLMAAIVSGIRDIFKIKSKKMQGLSESHNVNHAPLTLRFTSAQPGL